MTNLRASLSLRPTRIGFLVKPKDKKSIRKIMRLCTCLWGGSFNPIIPVCHSFPKVWSENNFSHLTGPELTEGFIQFFKPDVFVEASSGLAKKAGIIDSKIDFMGPRTILLDDFIIREKGRNPEFNFGLSVFDLYKYLYETEYKFIWHQKPNFAFFDRNLRGDPFFEAAFGVFPPDADISYFEQAYKDAFQPTTIESSAQGWLKLIKERYRTPFYIGRQGIDLGYESNRNPRIFIIDPTSPYDLIDLWNLRQFKKNILPISINWLSETKDFLVERIENNYRPLPGNPHGVMLYTVLEFGRSINKNIVESIKKDFAGVLPESSGVFKTWYDPIWKNRNDQGPNHGRLSLTAETKDFDAVIEKSDDPLIRFSSISPEFADRFGGRSARWVNVLQLKDFKNQQGLALALPSNVKNAKRDRHPIGESFLISDEGFVLLQTYKDLQQYFKIHTGEKALIDWLSTKGIKVTKSDPGRIANEMLKSLGGVWGTHLIEDVETLNLLDKMAKSVRRFEDEVEEEYPDRTASIEQWQGLIKRRLQRSPLPPLSVEDFINVGALKLGLMVNCSICEKRNWYSLKDLDETVKCERCLKDFKFPQGKIHSNSAHWHYRIAGPFSAPDYAGGAYGTILTLGVFQDKLGTGDNTLTYSTNLDLEINGKLQEIDFSLWFRRDRMFRQNEEPVLVFGEAKSFAKEAFGDIDILRMKTVAKKFPGAFLVFSVMKETLSQEEKKKLKKLALWGRISLPNGRPRSPVIILTGTEIFARFYVSETWKKLGGKRSNLVKHPMVWLDDLWVLADLTQQVYLNLPSHFTWEEDRFIKRKKRKTT